MKNEYIKRKLLLNFNGETREITQYHFLAWPDRGVPTDKSIMLSFLSELINEEKETKPIIIHCSAGVGRTGTFIALSHIYHTIEAQKNQGTKYISIFSIVRRLREQRTLMVQSKEQYLMLYDFLHNWAK